MKISIPRLVAATGVLVALVAIAPGVSLVAADPAGNNGTIKIDGTRFFNVPDNEPHVGCEFEIEFFGFDAGTTATVTFEGQPPSGTGGLDGPGVEPRKVDLGPSDHSGGGSARGWDVSQKYDLSHSLGDLEYHPKQGYHIKLTINADGWRGADVKHKVFWVQGCKADESPRNT